MKIGIVTTFDELNFGAYLQAYSLVTYLQGAGYYAELINYKSDEYRKKERIATYGHIKDYYSNLSVFAKANAFKKDFQFLSRSKKLSSLEEIDQLNYDLVIYGSDEIWNVENCIGVVDPYYFGAGISCPKISYAASFGSMTTNAPIPDEICRLLTGFKSVGVRDQNSQNIANKLKCNNVTLLPDPTFLVDHPGRMVAPRFPYIALYVGSPSTTLLEEIKSFADSIGMPVIALGYPQPDFISKQVLSPFEWVDYLRNAHYVVTDMFHGTVFSIKYKKRFAVEVTPYRKNKLESLLNSFDLMSHCYMQNSLRSILQKDLTSKNIDIALDEQRRLGRLFLEGELHKC